MLGPISGGYIVDLVGFDEASFLIAILFLLVGFFYAMCHCCAIKNTLEVDIIVEQQPSMLHDALTSDSSPLLINV
jgi:hypothetical protein